MGNFTSCPVLPSIKNSKVSRVLLPGGEIRQFRERVKAAEIMLENPSYFLVNASTMRIGRRFSALSADEELESGNIYIMFPMKRVNSVVTAADMTVILLAANSAAKRITGGNVKISPEMSPAPESTPENNAGHRNSEGFPMGQEMKYRLSCRSRKPSLETIMEEPVYSR
ncbi:putative GDSL esterase/lipase 6 [Capsicum annuum]|uniref:uncharacterized protein LOC107870681 n=1 Tax=Capsicum annuum TaxID=4072 RepID=UPI001FB06A27|nr:uncharacterized protein LOC107870681 [Capsicum annuum]KAF3679334.1 putative GDSL esterase/lipase 6 [Capsicum annuum]KAF3682926.1 putative GDSL esterase/lipase 6 [Capsicum annuum]